MHPDEQETAEAFELNITSERRARALDVLAALCPLPIAALAPLAWVQPDAWGAVALLLIFAWLTAGVLATMLVPLMVNVLQKSARGSLHLRAGESLEVYQGGRRVAEWSWRDVALVWPVDERTLLVWTQSGDLVRLVCRTRADAMRVLKRSASQRRKRLAYAIPLDGSMKRVLRKLVAWAFPLSFASLFVLAGPFFLPSIAAALGIGWLGARGKRRVVFGADGIDVHGRFRARYISYRDIARADAITSALGADYVRVQLNDGRVVRLRGLEWRTAVMLAALIREGCEMAQWGARAGAEVAQLRREGESEHAWRARIEGALADQSYRRGALDPERLMTLMRNPAADAEQRVAAALALRAHPEGITRIRVAAGVSAEPTVREAFQSLTGEEVDEQRIGRLLRRITEPQ